MVSSALAQNRQAQQRFGAESEAQIHFGFEPRIGVGVFEIHSFAVFLPPSRRFPYLMGKRISCWSRPKPDQRPDFVSFVIHQETPSRAPRRCAAW